MASVRITFLGTGAGGCIHRAYTTIVLDCPDGTRLLLDASSGNSVALHSVKTGMLLKHYEQVLLSHHHLDHMMGLPVFQFVRTATDPDSPPLRVYSSEQSLEALKQLCRATAPPLLVDQDGAQRSDGRQVFRWCPTQEGNRVQLGPTTVASSFLADHMPGAVGWRVESGGVVVVFSGDTRFSPGVVEAAQGASLLIHEALSTTTERELTASRGHSTAAEAGRAAGEAGVKELVITHISTAHHFDPQPLLDEARQHFEGPITVASDLYQLSVGTA